MMQFIKNGQPYLFTHVCSEDEVGKPMDFQEQKQLLVGNLLDIYSQCGMKASLYELSEEDLMDVTLERYDIRFPDICIDDFRNEKGVKAYYYVLPPNSEINIDKENVPERLRDSWVKVLYGTVYCLEKNTPDLFIKGASYASRYGSQALYPEQNNDNCTPMDSDEEIAKIYADAWINLDVESLYAITDKNLHYVSDFAFDDMASRDEYLRYLKGKFEAIRRANSIEKVQLAREREYGAWVVVVKQSLPNGNSMVGGFFIRTVNGLIQTIDLKELDMPDF